MTIIERDAKDPSQPLIHTEYVVAEFEVVFGKILIRRIQRVTIIVVQIVQYICKFREHCSGLRRQILAKWTAEFHPFQVFVLRDNSKEILKH